MRIYKLAMLVFGVLLTCGAWAEVPDSIRVQGRLQPSASLTGVVPSLLKDGTTVQTLTGISLTPDANGVFTTTLSGINISTLSVPGSYSITLSSSTGEILGTFPLRSVPFAFRASSADTLTSTGTIVVDAGTLSVDSVNNRVGIGTSFPASLLHVFGGSILTSQGDVQVSNGAVAITNTGSAPIVFRDSRSTRTSGWRIDSTSRSDGTEELNFFWNGAAGRLMVLDPDRDARGTVFVHALEASVFKRAIIPHPKQPDKVIKYTSEEGLDVRLFDEGEATLVQGETFVQFREEFSLTISTTVPPLIHVTPMGDCKGLYVAERSTNGFRVRELQNGASGVKFCWRVSAIRNGFENVPIVGDKPSFMK